MKPIAIVSGLSFAAIDRLLSVTCTDQDGNQSDTIDLEFDDRDSMLEIPEKGRIITASMGYRETGLVLMGRYTVEEAHVSGWPRKMKIRGKSADMRDKLKQQRNEAHEDKSVGDIVKKIAGRHGLAPFVSEGLANFKYPYIALSEESDMAFLTRLARRHDALFTVKNGKMMFVKRGEGKSMTGLPLGGAIIRGPGGALSGLGMVAGNVLDYDCSFQDRPRHGKTKSHWHDRKKVERQYEEGESTEGPEFLSRHPHPNKDEAKRETDAKGTELERSMGSLKLTVIGDAGLSADLFITVVGVRPAVDGMWRVKTATHTLDSSGYKTKLDCEVPNGSKGKAG